MKILLCNKHFLGLRGGAERNISDLANYFANLGHHVYIISETKHGRSAAFPLDERVAVIVPHPVSAQDSLSVGELDHEEKLKLKYRNDAAAKAWYENSRSMRIAWSRVIDKIVPDVIFTFMPHTSTIVLEQVGARYPVVVTNQNTPAVDYFSDKHGSDPYDLEKRLKNLKKAKYVHFLMPEFVSLMPSVIRKKSIVIPNCVQKTQTIKSSYGASRKSICAVGRLVPQKGFDVLIEAFAKMLAKYPDWILEIFGGGELEKDLRGMVRQLSLQRSIMLYGSVTNPLERMMRSDIFVIPSVYEGWGLSLTEAMSLGLPCVGFADCPGVNSLIEHNVTGLLAPQRSSASLLSEMERLILSEELRRDIGVNAHYSMEKYSPENVYPLWLEIAQRCCRRAN